MCLWSCVQGYRRVLSRGRAISKGLREEVQQVPLCSEEELDTCVGSIRWRLDAVAFGTLKNQAIEVPCLVEQIRLATQFLVWGERQNVPFMRIFRRHTMLEGFACALRTKATPQSIKLQAMQSLAILLPEVRGEASIRYLLSVLNPVFEIPPEFEDEDAVGYFALLLKSLALRLDGHTVRHCVSDLDSSFWIKGDSFVPFGLGRMPVFECAVKLVCHEELLVRTAARTAVLKVLQADHLQVRAIALHVSVSLLAPGLGTIFRSRLQRGKMIIGEDDVLDFVGELFNLGIARIRQALELQGFQSKGQPKYVPAPWKESRTCGVCDGSLGNKYLRPRLYCVACLASVCRSCSTMRILLDGQARPERMCKTCVDNADMRCRI